MKRMKAIAARLAIAPFRPAVVDEELRWFRMTGELPVDDRLAAAVVGRVAPGDGALESGRDEFAERIAQARIRVMTFPPPPTVERPKAREHLFQEALCDEAFVRNAARNALVVLVARGADPTDPQFLADRPLPTYGTVGLSVLGYPECLAQPPYETRAQRLFERLARLLDSASSATGGLEHVVDAIVQFELGDDLPADEQLRDLALAYVELDALVRHRKGEDMAILMDALDRAETFNDQARETARLAVTTLVHARRRSGEAAASQPHASAPDEPGTSPSSRIP